MRLTGALGVVALLSIGEAARADETHACVSAAYEGQRLRDEGKLTDARAELLHCAADRCPPVVVADCARWLAEIDAKMPSVVLAALDADRHDLLRVRVSIDGNERLTALDGRSIPIDIGPHTLRFEAEGKLPVEENVVIREGERGRVVTVTMRPVEPARAVGPASSTPPLWPTVVSGAIGIVAIGGFAILGATGQSDKNHLEQTCAATRSCASVDVDAARTKLIAADVALGVGIVALAAVGYLFVHRFSAPDPQRSARAPAPR